MNAERPEGTPKAPVNDLSPNGGADPTIDELAVELDTSRPSDAVLRAAPVAVERGLELDAAGAPSLDAPSLELDVASAIQRRPRELDSGADAAAPSGLPRWLVVALVVAVVALAAALGSVWLR